MPRPRSRSPRQTSAAKEGFCDEHVKDLVNEYKEEGCIFIHQRLLSDDELDSAESLLSGLVANRPEGLAPEDLMNLHTTSSDVLELCRHPRVVAIAKALLQVSDVSIFTSRILCKEAGTGKEIPWHQDSNYWPLIPPGSDDVRPEVASIWMPFDDVSLENGTMHVLPFTAQPETKNRNCKELIVDGGGATSFDNFNLSIDSTKLNAADSVLCNLKRGESEWHSAWTVHRSNPNKSSKRRLVWIVRYCPTGTLVRGGVRETFDSDYPIVPASGVGADACPVRAGEDLYAPCFGPSNTMKALKV